MNEDEIKKFYEKNIQPNLKINIDQFKSPFEIDSIEDLINLGIAYSFNEQKGELGAAFYYAELTSDYFSKELIDENNPYFSIGKLFIEGAECGMSLELDKDKAKLKIMFKDSKEDILDAMVKNLNYEYQVYSALKELYGTEFKEK